MPVRMQVSGGMRDDAVRQMQRDILAAQKAAIAGATEHAKESVRRAIRAYSDSPRLPNIVGSAVYPSGTRLAFRPAGSIYGRGKQASRILTQMESGAPIQAKGGRFLAIPLHSQRRGTGRGRLATPREIPGLFFIPAQGGLGGYVGILAVRRGQAGTRAGRGQVGRRRRLRQMAEQSDIVPMFALYRQVRSRKVFDRDQVVRSAMAQMPGLLDRAFSQMRSGASVRAAA